MPVPALGLVLALLAPAPCPPDEGPIRGEGVRLEFRGESGAATIRGAIWDRDRDGKPSPNDLMRIDEAEPWGASDVWVVLRGDLAKQVGRAFAAQRGLRARCEGLIAVADVPTFTSARALVGHLKKLGAGPDLGPEARLEADMRSWAAEICQRPEHTARASLQQTLVSRARESHKGVSARAAQAAAQEVAEAFEMECAHFKLGGGLTYP